MVRQHHQRQQALSEDVSNAAGVADELARDIPKRLKEMGRDMEVAFLGDQDHREGTTTAGITPVAGSWTSTSAQTLTRCRKARPPSGNVDTTTTSANMTEDVVRNLIESVATETGNQETLTAWVGPKIKRMFTNFTFCSPSAAAASHATQASGSTFNQDGTSGKIVRNVTSYEGDFGMLDPASQLVAGACEQQLRHHEHAGGDAAVPGCICCTGSGGRCAGTSPRCAAGVQRRLLRGGDGRHLHVGVPQPSGRGQVRPDQLGPVSNPQRRKDKQDAYLYQTPARKPWQLLGLPTRL